MLRGVPMVRKRDAKKLATTTVTNELADAVNSLAHGGYAGQHHEDALAATPVFFKVDGPGDDAGKFDASSFSGDVRYADGQDLVKADLGTQPDDPDVVVLDLNHIGASFGFVVTFTDDDKPVVLTNGIGNHFSVKLTQSGGGNGTQTTKATYTYVVKDLNEKVLDDTDATPLSPKKPREKGELVGPADRGVACWDENGDLVLEQAYEEYDTGPCP